MNEELMALVERESKLLAEYDEHKARCDDYVASDAAVKDDAKERQFMAHREAGVMAAVGAQALRSKIERAQRVEASRGIPIRKQSALSRALRAMLDFKDPANGLEAWEAKRYLVGVDGSPVDPKEPTPTIAGNDGKPMASHLQFRLLPDPTSPFSPTPQTAVIPASDTTEGKGVVPKQVDPRVVHDRSIFGKVGSTVRQLVTADGNDRGMIYRNATRRGNIRNAQGQAVAANDPAEFKNIVIGSFSSDSGEMKLQREFIEDVEFDVDAEMRYEGLDLIERAWNQVITKNQGGAFADKMPGLIGMAGHTTGVGKNAITSDNIVDIHEDLADYLTDSAAGVFPMDVGDGVVSWQADSSAVRLIWKLKDGDDRPLLQLADSASLSRGFPLMLMGIVLMRNNDMDSFAAGAASGSVPLMLMNGRYFTYRKVRQPVLHVFWDSRTMAQGMKMSYVTVQRRAFAAVGALSAGDGVLDTTRSSAISAASTA